MDITNKHNLPAAIYQAVSGMNRKPEPHRYHVTELIQPPLIRKLKMQHWGELEEDASERLWALLGSAVHRVLEKSGDIMDALKEEGLSFEYSGCTVKGTPDILHGTSLEDYKITSVYSFLLGEKKDWENQLNIYACMFEEAGFPVESARINAILRDWQKSKALRDRDYPEIPFVSMPVNLWLKLERLDYLTWRIAMFANVDDGNVEPTPCTDEERWARPTVYALMKKGRKTAVKLYQSKEEAKARLANEDDKHFIETRKGAYVRCESYCPVRTVCPYNESKTENYIEAI